MMQNKQGIKTGLISGIVYWLCNKIEIFIDYKTDIPLDSRIGKILTRTWETLLDVSVKLFRRGY